MGHVLTSTTACNTADAMALEKSKLAAGAKIVGVRRKAWNSHDLVYVVEGADGVSKDVTVSHAALKRRLSAASRPDRTTQ